MSSDFPLLLPLPPVVRLTQVHVVEVSVKVSSMASLESRAQSKVTQLDVTLEWGNGNGTVWKMSEGMGTGLSGISLGEWHCLEYHWENGNGTASTGHGGMGMGLAGIIFGNGN